MRKRILERCVQTVCGEGLCGHEHPGDRHPRQGVEARPLCQCRQQAGDARRLHHGPNGEDATAGPSCPVRAADRKTGIDTQLLCDETNGRGLSSHSDRDVPRPCNRRGHSFAEDAAHALDAAGRSPSRGTLTDLFASAQIARLTGAGDPSEMATQYLGLLWEDLMVSLLLGLVRTPKAEEIKRRAGKATTAFLQLHALAS